MKIYIDSGFIRFYKIVNSFGKKVEIRKDIYVAGVDSDRNVLFEKRNTKVEWQIEGEAYAYLCLVNYLKDKGISKAEVLMDNTTIFSIKKGKTKAKTYVWIADKVAKENNIDLDVKWVRSDENIADQWANKEVIFNKENR